MTRKLTVGVTGGNGFIGSYVCDRLIERGFDVAILDRMDHGAEHDLARLDRVDRWESSKADLHLGDIRDATAVHEFAAHVDGVIHLAGCLGTQETIENPLPAAETNILGGLNILQSVTAYGIPTVVITVGNWFEDNTYSLTKHTIERFCNMFRKYRGTQVTVVRALNAYGPKQSVAAPYGNSKVRKIMPSFINRALHGDPIEVYGDGQQIMDMIYVEDVAKALVAAWELTAAKGAQEQIFSAGSGVDTTVNQILDHVLFSTGSKSPVTHLPMRPGETPGAVVLGDPITLEPLSQFGFDVSSMTPLNKGVELTVTYYRELMERASD
jgi:UDP-glucose 4-epimerase